MLPGQAISLLVVSSIFPALACVAVGLRVYARQLNRTRLNASDYFIFFTLLNALLNAIACIIGAVACGIGLPLSELSDYLEVRFLKILFVTQFFYVFSCWSVKMSVLFFYRGVFSTRRFRLATHITFAVLVAWLIAFFFVTLFQDNPISRNWGTVGTTINWRIFYIVEVATDLALDLFILCMPLPVIGRLHISRRKKWLLSGVFWLGAVIIIASTVRLVYMIQVMQQFEVEDDDFSFTTVNTIIWGSIEPCTSVVAACLPILGPVIFRKRRRTTKPNVISSFFQQSRSKQSDRTPKHARTDSTEGFSQNFNDDFERGPTNLDRLNGNAIQVTRDFSVEAMEMQ